MHYFLHYKMILGRGNHQFNSGPFSSFICVNRCARVGLNFIEDDGVSLIAVSLDAYHRLDNEALTRGMRIDQLIDELAQQFPPLPGPFPGEGFDRIMSIEDEATAAQPTASDAEN